MTRTYNIAKLKAGLSAILADVASGAEVVITDHNKPVARLSSLRRLPPLPSCDIHALLAEPPLPLKRGTVGAAALVRRMRDEQND